MTSPYGLAYETSSDRLRMTRASTEHLRDLQGLERIRAAFRCATLDDVHCGAWLPAWLARVCGFDRTHPAMAAAGLLAATMHVVRGRPSSAVGGVVAGSLVAVVPSPMRPC